MWIFWLWRSSNRRTNQGIYFSVDYIEVQLFIYSPNFNLIYIVLLYNSYFKYIPIIYILKPWQYLSFPVFRCNLQCTQHSTSQSRRKDVGDYSLFHSSSTYSLDSLSISQVPVHWSIPIADQSRVYHHFVN